MLWFNHNGTFTVIVRGTNFGTPQDQPSDLICRIKVPDYEVPLKDETGPATVINDIAIACTLVGYSTSGTYGIAVESASHSDPANTPGDLTEQPQCTIAISLKRPPTAART